MKKVFNLIKYYKHSARAVERREPRGVGAEGFGTVRARLGERKALRAWVQYSEQQKHDF